MDYFQALVLAVVEGFSEFLPISSTGHLVLTSKVLGIPQTEFVKSFEVIIQLGAILAIVFLYWEKIRTDRKIWKSIIFAFIPTAFVGLIFYDVIKNLLLGSEMVTVAALFIGGIVMIITEYWLGSKKPKIGQIRDITPKKAIIIGFFQSISIVPGVSRAAATIIGAMLLGANRKTAVEFSFLLAIPTMTGAVGLDLLKSNFSFAPHEWSLLAVGFAGSFFVAILAVKFFVKFVQNHTFIPFGIYRIILALAYFILVL